MCTPKTMKEAIDNGLTAAYEKWGPDYIYDDVVDQEKVCMLIEAHIRDFLAQRFGVAFLDETNVQALWKQLFPDSFKEACDKLQGNTKK